MANNAITTLYAKHKILQARAGEAEIPKIVGMAFGDGGTDAQGTVIPPNANQSELRNEIYRKVIDSYEFLEDTVCRYKCTLQENELVGKEISEVGLYDEDGKIVCIKTFTRKGKDSDIKQTYMIDDSF